LPGGDTVRLIQGDIDIYLACLSDTQFTERAGIKVGLSDLDGNLDVMYATSWQLLSGLYTRGRQQQLNIDVPSEVTNLMIGTLAFEMIATVSVMYACRMALASSASSRALFCSVTTLFDTTKSISLIVSTCVHVGKRMMTEEAFTGLRCTAHLGSHLPLR
jgi:hypothetical protein